MSEATLLDATVTVDIDVRFAETDAMGVAHHASYIVWFEVGRVAWMQAVQMPYAEIAASGHHLAVTGLRAEYRSAARFGDRVRIRTRLTQLRSRQVEFTYALHKAADDTLLVTGSSQHICVDLAGRMAKLPAFVFERLHQGAAALATQL